VSTIVTDKGVVEICKGFPADGKKALVFGLDTSDPAYQPIYTRKQSLKQLAAAGGTLCLALFRKTMIIGYAVIAPPSQNSRWARADFPAIQELKAVEVARPFRNRGIAGSLLTCLFSGSDFSGHIVVLSAYAWLWDMAHTDLSCWAYREMLMALYARFGFESFQTNEPNVCLKPENIFMARIGQQVSLEDRERFKWLRFGIPSPIKNSFGGKTVEHSEKNSYFRE
jgi:acetoin utilization protein AcuA